MAKVAVPSAQGTRIVPGYLKSLGIQYYDLDNKYPNRLENAIAASGTASACADLMSTHLRGQGYLNPEIEKLIVNAQGQTLGDIHKLLCNDRSLYRGFAYWIGYNAAYEVTEIKHVPFGHCRLPIPDEKTGDIYQIWVHPDWNQENVSVRFDKTKIQKIDLFNPDPAAITEQIVRADGWDKWMGQIFWHSDAGFLKYPKGVVDPVLEDVQTDSLIKTFKFRGVSTGWNCDYAFIHRGKLAEDELKQLSIDLNKFQGADNSNKIMVVASPKEELDPKLVKFDKVDNDTLYKDTEESVKENIVGMYSQPIELHAIKTPSTLGMNKDWEEARINYDKKTEDIRTKLGRAFLEPLKIWHEGDPAPDDNYTIVPLTGIAEKKEVKSLADRLLVGTIQSLQTTLESSILGPQQKVNYLIAVFGIQKDIAEALVNGTPLPDETN